MSAAFIHIHLVIKMGLSSALTNQLTVCVCSCVVILGRLKMQDWKMTDHRKTGGWKMQDWNLTDQIAG